jgi:cytidylate kinase
MKTYIKFLEKFEKEFAKKIKKKGLTITVSGVSGAGKTDGAKALAKAFKLKYVSAGEIQRQIAKERGLSLEEQVDIREPEIDHEMDKRSLELAMKGKVVLDGRLTGWAAGEWADVKVWYECPLKVRTERVAKRDNISLEEASKNLRERDDDDHKKYSELYGIDSFDRSIYDIKINNEKLTKKEAKIVPVKLIKEFLKKKYST